MTKGIYGHASKLALCLVLAAVPASAVTIQNGSDLWRTPGDGTTFADFASDPLPADFFCSGSAPFAGQVVFQGVPLVTEPPGVLGTTDTIVQRLDDAAFDRDGVAVTRVQMRAMQFEGTGTFRNACGTFAVSAALEGEQPVTEMRIHRTGRDHGFFESLIGVEVRVSFTPIDHKGPVLSLHHSLRFDRAYNAWTSRTGAGGVTMDGFVLVDTDADGVADTHLPATSRDFAAGWMPEGGKIVPFSRSQHVTPPGAPHPSSACEGSPCSHCTRGHSHCVEAPIE